MNIKNKLNFSKEKAAVLDLHKSPQSQVVAIGLNKGQQLKKHVTHVPTLLMVLEGEIKIIIEDKKMHFSAMDVYPIPVNIPHETHGVSDESIFILIKDNHK